MSNKHIDKCGFSFLSFQKIIWNEHLGDGACGSVYKCKYNDTICIGKCFYYRDYENKKGLINDVYSELSIYKSLMNVTSTSEIIGYSYDEEAEYICILMKYQTSLSLNDYIKYYTITDKEKMYITKTLCDYLKEIHSRNIIHCDIKPHNIIYEIKEKKIVFIDFGASTEIDSSKSVEIEENMGTEGYMSEELSLGYASYKSDIYSLAVTILELWIKDIWYITKTYRKDILYALKRLDETNPSLSIILRKCLAKDVNKRISLNTLISKISGL
jgi:serine/threonine protein kinase